MFVIVVGWIYILEKRNLEKYVINLLSKMSEIFFFPANNMKSRSQPKVFKKYIFHRKEINYSSLHSDATHIYVRFEK